MTEHNIFQEIEADLEHQRYEELWKRYGKWIMAAAVLVVLATAGVSSWRSWHAARNQEATSALLKIIEKPDEDSNTAQQMGILEKFALAKHDTAHDVLAQLSAAGLAASVGNNDRAVQLYDEVAKDPGVDPVFRQFADLMVVRAQMDSGDPAQLEKRLEPLLVDNVPWHYTAMETDGFLALRAGNKEKAQRIFAELSQDARVPDSLSARAANMLHFLSE